MSKLDKILGAKFQENKGSIVTRTFEMGGHTFKIRIPTVGETESMYERLSNPDEAQLKTVFENLTKDLLKYKDEPNEAIEFKDDDVIADGRSLKEAAKNTVMAQARIMEYFKLIVPDEGQSWDGLEYSDIEESMPWAIQIELVQKIMEVISPNYKDIRGK